MFGFRPKLPITEDERVWVDVSLKRLTQLLGRAHMFNAEVVLPPRETAWHGAKIIKTDLLDARSKKFVRHGPPEKLEQVLLSLL